MNSRILVLILMLVSFFPVYVTGSVPQSERDALIAFYNSCNGDQWKTNTGWKSEPLHSDGFALPGTESGWFGLSVSFVNGREHITSISMVSNNVTGTLPTALGATAEPS